MTNYLPDVNKFKLAGPPAWFLRQLMEFDPSLAIVPSRQGFYYRLAQRRKLNLPEKIVNESLWNESDTQMLASYSLVPVTTILATVNWSNPLIFSELAKRAPWRMGGAEKVNKMLDAQDLKEDLATRVKTNEHLDYLAKDSWKYYNKLIGTRSHLYSPTVKQAPSTSRPASPLIKIADSSQPYKPEVTTIWGGRK